MPICAPQTADLFETVPETERPSELARILELGTQTSEVIRSSTTLRLVEAQIAAMMQELGAKLSGLLVADRAEALKQTKETLDDHRARLTTTLARYIDPESQASLPVAMAKIFDHAANGLVTRIEKLLEEGDDSAFGRLAEHVTKEIDKAVALVIDQMAARHALRTKSSLAGRPYEDAIEERLIALTRPLGDNVTRCGDTLGQARTKKGDLTITLPPEAARGEHDVRIVIEAKRRGDHAQAFSAREIERSLTLARRNRGATAGIFVAESAAFLPLGLGFHELGASNMAIAWDPEADDLALAIGYRLVRFTILQDLAATSGEEVDRDAHRRIVSEVRVAVSKLDVVRGQHQAAINSINRASTGINEVSDKVLNYLRQLDDLMAA